MLEAIYASLPDQKDVCAEHLVEKGGAHSH